MCYLLISSLQHVLGCFFCCRDEVLTKDLGKRGFIGLISVVWLADHQWKPRQEPDGRNCSRSHGGLLFVDLFPQLAQLLSYMAQDYLASKGSTHNGLGPSSLLGNSPPIPPPPLLRWCTRTRQLPELSPKWRTPFSSHAFSSPPDLIGEPDAHILSLRNVR